MQNIKHQLFYKLQKVEKIDKGESSFYMRVEKQGPGLSLLGMKLFIM